MPITAEPLTLLPRKPWYFRLASAWINSGLRGGYRWLAWLERSGKLSGCAPFALGDGVIYLPLDTIGATDVDLFDYYERQALDAMAWAGKQFESPPLVIDCGADVGVYTRLLIHRGLTPAGVIAIEPNPRTFPLLKTNLAPIESPCTCFHGAVSDTPGHGRLQAPDYDPNQDRAAFISLHADGDIAVETVDRLVGDRIGAAIALKIDVEGAELAVLQGATSTLRAAPGFVVQFEAHPVVAKRGNVDPIGCLRLLVELGARYWMCSVEATGAVYAELTLDKPFFEQMPDTHIFDVVASTHPVRPDGGTRPD